MPAFKYKAKDGPNKIVEGRLDAASRTEAVNKLTMMGYFPISVTPAGDNDFSAPKRAVKSVVRSSDRKVSAQEASKSMRITLFNRIVIKDLSMFTRQLADLIDSGVTLFRSVSILAEQCTNPAFKKILEDVQSSIKDGKTLHESLGKHGKVFSPLFVNMVKSGEIGGMLETVLERLADFSEQEEETRSKIKQAMAYPLVMAGMGVLMITVLMTFVIPRLVKLFSDMGQTLPMITQIVIGISIFMSQYWYMMIIGLAVVFYIFQKWKQTENGSYIVDKFKLSIPVMKDLILKDEIARFGRTLSTLLNNGVPILQSLTIIVDTIRNKVIRNQISGFVDDISKGSKLGECLKNSPMFPGLFVNMVSVGEESGHIEKSLEKVAESYDKQVDRTIKVFTTLLEPLMIVVLGAVLGVIIISIIMPIFDISNIAQ